MPGTNLTREEAQTRAALLDVESYTVDLDLTTGARTVFLDVSSRVVPTGERGLLGVAFHPAYQSNGQAQSSLSTSRP